MTIALRPEITFTPTGLSLPPDLSYEEWADYGERLAAMEAGLMWALGDWWRYGEHRYGERAYQAAKVGYSADTLRAAAWVAGRIEPVRRRTLPWSHHREVASLPPSEQDEWLDQAEAEGLTRSELRGRMRPRDDSPWDTLQRLLGRADEVLGGDLGHIASAVPVSHRQVTAIRLHLMASLADNLARAVADEKAPAG